MIRTAANKTMNTLPEYHQNKRPTWYTREVKQINAEKDKAYRRYKNAPNPSNFIQLKKWTAKYRQASMQSRRKKFETI
jgi:hypothetical protein